MRFLKKYYKLIGTIVTVIALVFVVKKIVTMDVDWSMFASGRLIAMITGCALLHTRITREVLPALENALAAMGLASQRPRCSPINAHIRGASHLFGQRCPEQFAQATGRAGAKCAKWSKLNAQPVTERVLSAIRVAAMGKERYWIKRPASGLGCR